MWANTQGGGCNVGAPDVGLTDAMIPIPFVNTSMCANGVGFVPHIITVTGCAHNQGTTIPVSMGDEAGTMGGVVSGTNMDVTSYIVCSNTVLTGGMPTARMTSVTLQNAGNVVGATVAPSQTKVLILAP